MNALNQYMNTTYHFDKITTLANFSLLWTIAGIYGFIYEMIFYYLNGGMKYVYWRGGCFGPWILIYSLGSLLIYFLSYRFKRNPIRVMLFGGLGCGVFELISGAILFYGFGHRGWDYNTERWNFGNIGGFICLRSIVVFAISSLLLVYVILPFIFFLSKKIARKAFCILAFTIFALCILDNVYNLTIAKFFGCVSANQFYQSWGLHTINYY